MTDLPTPDDDPDGQWLSSRLQRQVDDVELERPPEERLHGRIAARRRRRVGSGIAGLALVAGTLGLGAAALLGDDGGNQRVQVASPDADQSAGRDGDDSSESADRALDEGARDRSGSGLTLSPLPLETASVTLPADVEAWQMFQADGYLYAAGFEVWLQRTADLETWEPIPEPPVADLLDSVVEGQWPNYHFQQTAVSGDTIATVVSVFPADWHDEPASPTTAEDEEWVEIDPFQHCSFAARTGEETHIVVSTDGGVTWSATRLDGDETERDDFITGGLQASVAASGDTVLVATGSFEHLDVHCLLADRGLIDADRQMSGLSFGGRSIDIEFTDGTRETYTADELDLTEAQRLALEGSPESPHTVRRWDAGALTEIRSLDAHTELLGTPEGFVLHVWDERGPTSLRSTDGGVTWVPIDAPAFLHGAHHNATDLLASDGFTTYVSTDLGLSWEELDAPAVQAAERVIKNGDLTLAVTMDYAESRQEPGFEFDVAITNDGRTLTIENSAEGRVTVVDDATNEVLFSTSNDRFGGPPEGVIEGEDGVEIVDADGNLIFAATYEQLQEAFEAAFEAAGGDAAFDDEFVEPDTLLAIERDGQWTVTSTAEVFGANTWIVYAAAWGDGFVVVGEPAYSHDAMDEMDDIDDEAFHEVRPPQVVLLTP